MARTTVPPGCAARPEDCVLGRTRSFRLRALPASLFRDYNHTPATSEFRQSLLGVVPEQVGSSGPPWRLRAAKHSQSQGGHRMKLHANAALSWQGGVGWPSGWSMRDGRWRRRPRPPVSASAARASGWAATGRRASSGLLDRSSAPRRVANRTRRAGRGDRRCCAGCASRRPRSPRRWGWRSRPCRGSSPGSGMGRLGRLGLEPAERYERARPGELIHIDVKKLGPDQRGAGQRVERPQALQPRPHRRRGPPPAHRRLGVRARRRSTTTPAWPTPKSSPTRRPPPRSASCAARSPSTAATASRSSR